MYIIYKMFLLSLYQILAIIFVSTFIINYYVVSYITCDTAENVTNSVGKMYISFIIAGLVTLVELVINDFSTNVTNWSLYFMLLVIVGASIMMYRTQAFIDGKQYLRFVLENDSKCLLPTLKVIENSDSKRLTDFARTYMKQSKSNMTYSKNLMADPNIG
jgi:hypothetical protein